MKELSNFELVCEFFSHGITKQNEAFNIANTYEELSRRFKKDFAQDSDAWAIWFLTTKRFSDEQKKVFSELKNLQDLKTTYEKSWQISAQENLKKFTDYQLVVQLLLARYKPSFRRGGALGPKILYSELCKRAAHNIENNEIAWIDWVLSLGNCTQKQSAALNALREKLVGSSNNVQFRAQMYDLIAACSD